jgi:hypothetical protein
VVRLTAELKRAKLQALSIQGTQAGDTLLNTLQNFLLAQDVAYGQGRVVVAHAGAGKSTQFKNAVPGEEWQQGEFYKLAQEFIETYNDAVAFLIFNKVITQPPVTGDSSQDPTIFGLMMADDRLQDISKTQPDFTTLLFPNR